MPKDINRLKESIQELIITAQNLLPLVRSDMKRLRQSYETWYSVAHQLIAHHLPNRLSDFEFLYASPRMSLNNYAGIRSYLDHPSFIPDNSWVAFVQSDIERQVAMLSAILDTIDLRSLEVRALVTADVVEGELGQARILLEYEFLRAAGAVAGVALEAHLKLLHTQAELSYGEKDSIQPLAERLCKAGFISLGDQKKCTAMADTRHKCTHKKDTEPTREEVQELVDDVDRFTKRVQVY